MHILVRSLLEITRPDGQQEVVRVLAIDHGKNLIHVIRIDRSDALPEARQLGDIEAGLGNNITRILTADPFAYLQKPAETISAQHVRRRDAAWRIWTPVFPWRKEAIPHTRTTPGTVKLCESSGRAGGLRVELADH